MELRPYQNDAVYETCRAWKRDDKVLASLPTGTGKSVIAAYLCDAWRLGHAEDYGLPDRVLWLAHLDELIWQAAEHVERWCGEPAAVEKGEFSRKKDARQAARRVVVSSVQTMSREGRQALFGDEEFGLLIVDECHHAVAESYGKILDYFQGPKILGLTATCDRTDEVPLGKVFDQVAYHYAISDAVQDGWLAPIVQQSVRVDELDWSRVRLDSKGDLSAADLDRIIAQEEAVHRIVAPLPEIVGDRPTLVFTPSVRTARMIADLLPRYTEGGARWASGETPDDERRRIVDGYRNGEYQYLCSCDLLREGFDAPATACIVMARPTKSRLVYAQAVGRGLRGGRNCPVPGKEDCLVIDLVGASLKHKLATTVELLGGRWAAVVQDEALRIVQSKRDVPADVMAAILEAASRADELRAAERRRIIAEAKIKRKTVDPFLIWADLTDLKETEHPAWWHDMLADDDQAARLKVEGWSAEGLSYVEAKQLLDECSRRKRVGLCSAKQAKLLRPRGFSPNMTAGEAGDVLEYLASREGGWNFSRIDAVRISMARKRNRPFTYRELAIRYTVPADLKAKVRRSGEAGWRDYVTTKRTVFSAISQRFNDAVVFASPDGRFELQVPTYQKFDPEKGEYERSYQVDVTGWRSLPAGEPETLPGPVRSRAEEAAAPGV